MLVLNDLTIYILEKSSSYAVFVQRKGSGTVYILFWVVLLRKAFFFSVHFKNFLVANFKRKPRRRLDEGFQLCRLDAFRVKNGENWETRGIFTNSISVAPRTSSCILVGLESSKNREEGSAKGEKRMGETASDGKKSGNSRRRNFAGKRKNNIGFCRFRNGANSDKKGKESSRMESNEIAKNPIFTALLGGNKEKKAMIVPRQMLSP